MDGEAQGKCGCILIVDINHHSFHFLRSNGKETSVCRGCIVLILFLDLSNLIETAPVVDKALSALAQ